MSARVATRIFLGAARIDAVDAGDRGLSYGDGLFETMRVFGGCVPWWDAHWARLLEGARRLCMRVPERKLVEAQVADLCADAGDGVLKLILTRGANGRGYALPTHQEPAWILSRHPPPAPPPPGGLHVRWCTTRLAIQPALAGMKHCNRLEQVLARAEWSDPRIDEGLMREMDGDVVSATAANLFVFRDGIWRTPRVDRSGIAGVCRAWLLASIDAAESRLSTGDIEGADAIVLCNAVRGILPVSRLGDRAWPPHPEVRALRRRLASAHPAFPEPEDNA